MVRRGKEVSAQISKSAFVSGKLKGIIWLMQQTSVETTSASMRSRFLLLAIGAIESIKLILGCGWPYLILIEVLQKMIYSFGTVFRGLTDDQ